MDATSKKEIFRVLYETYYHTMLSIACKYVDIEVAKDIVHDIFFKLWTTSQNCEKTLEFRFYLYSAVRNRSLNYIRNKKVEEKYLNRSDFDSDDFFYNAVLEEEIFIQLRKAVNELPEKYQSVINFFLEGLKDKEIAEKLNITEEVVRTRKKRGKDLLKNKLDHPILIILINLM